MQKRGKRGIGKVTIVWSSKLAYAVGLLATDGCLYNDKLHMSLTTKDLEQAENFKKCLGIGVKIGLKGSGSSKEKKYYHVQFGDVLFYRFLLSVGLTPAKSKTIGKVAVPEEYFFDFLRGCFDGDGSFYSYWDPRWRSSHMFYVIFASASKAHIDWLQDELCRRIGVTGHVTKDAQGSTLQLKYAKREAPHDLI